jgi:hypothetical protein
MKTPRQLVKVQVRRGVFVRITPSEAKALGLLIETNVQDTTKKAAAPQNKKTSKPRNKKAEEPEDDNIRND